MPGIFTKRKEAKRGEKEKWRVVGDKVRAIRE